mgnify:CR=1 FL=1
MQNLEKVKIFAESAWKQMAETGIPPLPENYRIWYSHYAGLDLDLKREIDRLVAERKEITLEVHQQLHQQLQQKNVTPEFLNEIHSTTRAILTDILTGIMKTADSNQAYRSNLQKFAN